MVSYEQMLEAGVHFGHLSRKWNPAMKPYIFDVRNDIHIIDLLKTVKMLEEACRAVEQLAKSGRKILFVGTKKQSQAIIAELAESVNMPYVTNRWLGGMLTNFQTVRRSVRRLQQLEQMITDGGGDLVTKKELLMMDRERGKLEDVLGGIKDMSRLPSALFIVDIKNEHIAVAEARKLNIPTIAIVDTNSDPNAVDFPIPGNDDAAKSIHLITSQIVEAIKAGHASRAEEKAMQAKDNAAAGDEDEPVEDQHTKDSPATEEADVEA